jgi:hypothetical protein
VKGELPTLLYPEITKGPLMLATDSRITAGSKLDPAHQERVLEEFYREGFALVGGVLSADEVACLRGLADDLIDNPDKLTRGYASPVYNAMVLRCTQALHRAFCDMLIREPFLSLAEAILGPNVAFCGQNVIRSEPGTGISLWHVDDILEFPLPPEVPRHDPRIRMPVFWFSFQIALSDINSPENGPTEIVPGSHYSGRDVPRGEGAKMEFDGRGPVPVLCKAGDIYLFNHQLWHRGAVNTSERRRYLMQNQYCRAWGPYRFNSTDASVRLPDDEMAALPERAKQLLDVRRSTSR